MTAYKLHEARMWTVQVFIPMALLGAYLWNETHLFDNTKAKIKTKLQERKMKKESKKA